MNPPIRVLLVDDHQLLRQSLVSLLQAEDDIEVVGSLGSADEALEAARTHKPQVILMDIDMPGRMCFEVARELKREDPEVHILFLSAFFHDRYIEAALRSKASGYLTKDQSGAELAEAIRRAAEGVASFSERVRSRLVLSSGGELQLAGSGTLTRSSALTQRELEVLRYAARGLAKKEIAQLLGRSPATVERHIENLMAKLDIHDRVELARFAIREGLAEA